jgi:hypothetical protein
MQGVYCCLRSYFFSYLFFLVCGWPRPVSSRSAKLPGWRSPPIVIIVIIIPLHGLLCNQYSPTQTCSNIWAWCATSKSIYIPRLTAICPFTAGTFRVKSLFKNIALLTGYMRYQYIQLFQDVPYSCWYVCESDLGRSLLTTRQGDGQSLIEMAVGSIEKDVGG